MNAKPEVELESQQVVDKSQQVAETPVETQSIHRSGRIHQDLEKSGFL